MSTWDIQDPGVVLMPSGRRIRGRSLRKPPTERLAPEFGLYLLNHPPKPVGWHGRRVRWPDFRLPVDRDDAVSALQEAWQRSASERVEVACLGGKGRTATALACLAVLDGVPARHAVAYVREQFGPGAVETPWQHRYVRRFPTG